jgi:spore maturation protein CgeB
MRVLYHIPYPDGLGADRWICEGWREGFRALGHEFHLLTAGDRLIERARTTRPGLFFTAVNLIDLEREQRTLRALREQGTKVLLWVHWPLEARIDPRRAEVLRRDDVADVYFGEREPEQMRPFEQETGKPYHVIPNAANPALHFPVPRDGHYQYDIVYLGANLRKKRWFAEHILRPLKRKYRVGVFGPGWSLGDQALRAGSRLCRLAGAFRIARTIDRARIAVPPDAERVLYSSAAVSLNFHEREDDGSQPHYIVNQRTFKIPACGGFQICDEVPAIRKYFGEDELVMAPLDPGEWMARIDHFLGHQDEREAIRARGAQRALREHLSTNRVKTVLALVGAK